MDVTLIHNPQAGSDDQPSGKQIVSLIRSAGHSPTYYSSMASGWEQSLERPADIVAVAGGDGIVGKVAKHLIGKPVPIALLPLGTANNIANALGLAERPLDRLVAGWKSARRIEFDAAAASGPWGSRYFIEGLGLGLFADTMSRLDARNNVDIAHHKVTGQKLTSVLELMNFRLGGCTAVQLKVKLDERDLSGAYLMLEVMNIRYIGPNLCLAPDADPSDGWLDLALVANDQRGQLQNYLSDRLEGKSDCALLNTYKGRHLHIECERLPIHIDDEVYKKNGPTTRFAMAVIDVTLESGALQFLTPE